MAALPGISKSLAALVIIPLALSACEQPDPADAGAANPATNANGLLFPAGCELGKDCWIARYVDHGQNGRAQDYLCGEQSQTGHKGTDIAIADMGRMEAGVSVLATADGKVLRIRDGIRDISVRRNGAASNDGQECGNGIMIEHSNGDRSQYCHVKNGSIRVASGDSVKAGAKIAEIGLSGETEFPHLHYTLYRDGDVIDPFDGSKMNDRCDAGGPLLWANDLPYEALTLFDLRVGTKAPSREKIWQAGTKTLESSSPAMVITARAMFTRNGDSWHMQIRNPKGKIAADQKVILDDDKQFYYHFIGIKRPAGGFMPGIWTGELTARRGDDTVKKIKVEFRTE
ncbi:M23 family metallopeptidase [Kordiimonas sp.]|uniref:M23 family metallopeptidase n=1 Tax=Kordiimonas sp. TaxID=1970157 RepID=UPI003A947192